MSLFEHTNELDNEYYEKNKNLIILIFRATNKLIMKFNRRIFNFPRIPWVKAELSRSALWLS